MNISGQGNWMDKLFHKKLSDFEVKPEDHVWEGIAKRLDDEKKRPGLFGNWWTVLLSIIMLLLVTGVGAYMLYKRNYLQKTEKNQNKDLPYLQQDDSNNGTAYTRGANIRTLVATPHPHSVINKVKNPRNTTPPFSLSSGNVSNEETLVQSKLQSQESDLSFIQSLVEIQNPGISAANNEFNANDLIVSSDEQFYVSGEIKNKQFSYSYLPLKESFLTKQNKKLTSSSFVDGCNIYRDNKTHFFLDVYYAPEIASRSLKSDDPALQAYVEERSNSEKPMLSYSAGIKASIVFGSGLSVRGGLSYSKNSERFDFIKERQKITKEIKDQNGNVIRTEITELVITDKVYNQYQFIDIPILVGYEKDLKDFILSVNGGIGLNLSANQTGKIYKQDIMSVYLLENNGEANEPIFRKNAGISLIGSIGLNYKYNERIMLLLEPSARYYVKSLSDPVNPVSQNYLFLGMNVGLRYRIK